MFPDLYAMYLLSGWWTLSGGFSRLSVTVKELRCFCYLYFTLVKLYDLLPLNYRLCNKGVIDDDVESAYRLMLDLKVIKETEGMVIVTNEDHLIDVLCSELGDTITGNMHLVYSNLCFPVEEKLEELATLLFLYKVFNAPAVMITDHVVDFEWLGKILKLNGVKELPVKRISSLLDLMRGTAVGGRL